MSKDGAMGEASWSASIQRGVLLSLCEIGKFSARLVAKTKAKYKETPNAFINGGIIIGGVSIWSLYMKYRSNRRLVRDIKVDEINENISNDSLEGLDITQHYRGLQDATFADPVTPSRQRSPSNKLSFNFPDVYDTANENRTLVIGVAGGSGSGKTTLCEKMYAAMGEENMTYIQHDKYYRDLGHMTVQQRAKVNFDHPDSLETELLIEHVKMLKQKMQVVVPEYDFSTHTRGPSKEVALPRPVLLVEGLLIFANPELADLFDIKIYVHTDDDIRIIRRIQRDVNERGRTLNSVVQQYMATVRPMHLKFVEPTRYFADMIIPEGYNNVALDMILNRLHQYCQRSKKLLVWSSQRDDKAGKSNFQDITPHAAIGYGFFEAKESPIDESTSPRKELGL